MTESFKDLSTILINLSCYIICIVLIVEQNIWDVVVRREVYLNSNYGKINLDELNAETISPQIIWSQHVLS